MSETSPRRRWATRLLLFAGVLAIPLTVAASGRGWGGHCSASPKSAAELATRIDDGADRFYGYVDATDAQQDRIDAVLDGLAPTLWELKGEKDAIREDARAALAAEKIDPAAIEEVRLDGLALADAASKEMAAAIVQVASILTVEQRTELLEDVEKWHR